MALDEFNEIFYTEVKERLRKELLMSFISSRNVEVVDKVLMSGVIRCYVMQGFVGAEPIRESANYFWEGWRNLTFYESEFEE